MLGDGDFSFSRGLIAHRGSAKNLVCTSFEAETDLLAKYGEKAEKCLAACAQAVSWVPRSADRVWAPG